MDSPFYGSYWDLPSRPRAPAGHAPSVREIPVHYVGSEKQEVRIPSEKRSDSRSESALKIQRLFRGFLVRKSVKRIVELRAEVGEIEKMISKTETVELLGRDSKERLRVNETLMSLLFKLDSVRGVDSGVRDCRKAVIKRIIKLQEILDAVVVSNNDNCNVDQAVVDDVVDQTLKVDCTENDENRDGEEIVNDQSDNPDKEVVDNNDMMPSPVSDCPEESVGTSQTDSRSDSSFANTESLVEACEEDDASSLKQEKNDGDGIGTDQIEDKGENVKESKEGNVSNREVLLERMMEDNEKMMDLMAQLFERNEMQTRLLSSLSQRVEQLERAFLFERLRKKKRQAAACTVDGCDMSPGVKKCGKR